MPRRLRFLALTFVAGTIAYPPSIAYGQRATLTVTGLAPNTAYRLVVYAPV